LNTYTEFYRNPFSRF